MDARRVLLEYDFSSRQLVLLDSLAIGVSSVSFVGGLFVVTSFLRFKTLRNKFAFEQVANMALADMGACFSYFLASPRDRTTLCTLQAVVQQFFELASVLWAAVIATTLSMAVRRRQGMDVSWRPIVYGVAWGIPFVFALLPLTTESYGSAGAWCWIRNRPPEQSRAWRFAIFYGPIWICILYCGKVYASSAIVLHRLSSTVAGDDASVQLKKTIKRLVRYPLILVVCWTFPTINRIQQIIRENPIFALYVLTVISRSMIGALNAVAFGATEIVKVQWASARLARQGSSSTSRLVFKDTRDGQASLELPPTTTTSRTMGGSQVFSSLDEHRNSSTAAVL